MTFEELPKYCSEHNCWKNQPESQCEYINLCTRFYKKYGHPPSVFKRSGLPPDKFKVSVDTSWGKKTYREYYIAAKTPSKATYRVAKMMGMRGKQFKIFLNSFQPCTERIPSDSDIDYYLDYEETDYGSGKFKCERVEFGGSKNEKTN